MIQRTLQLIVLATLLSSCTKLMGDLRKDLNDQAAPPPEPTVGGTWSERGLLNDRPRYLNHNERGPASSGQRGEPYGRSWVNNEADQSNRRDQYRGVVAYSNSPNQPPRGQGGIRYNERATANDFIDQKQDEGSLWASDGQTNYFFTKNRVKGLGDIVSLNVQDHLVKDIALEIKKTLSPGELKRELAIEQERINKKFLEDFAKNKQSARAPAAQASGAAGAEGDDKDKKKKKDDIPDPPKANLSDVNVKERIGIKEGDQIMGEVIERFPNGNYKIRGTKRVGFGDGMRMVTVIGIAKADDVNGEQAIETGKLYEYRVKSYR